MPADQRKSAVPMEIEYAPAWLTWVASTTTCLRALGVDCDQVDVAGMSGYAFMISISEDLCPSGPTMFDWGTLEFGIHFLGRSTLSFGTSDCHTGDFRNDRTREHCRYAFDLARREVENGRPCVVWGAYVPEFAVVTGIDGDNYIVKSFRQCMGETEEPIPFDGIDAPGGPYLLAFPTVSRSPFRQVNGDRLAVSRAVQLLTQRALFNSHGFGLKAYDHWVKGLKDNRAISFGNAYNAQCYAEGRCFAHEFMKRVADRNETVAETLNQAAGQYNVACKAMKQVAELFPFPAGNELDNPDNRKTAIDALRYAQAAESKAVELMSQAAANKEWRVMDHSAQQSA